MKKAKLSNFELRAQGSNLYTFALNKHNYSVATKTFEKKFANDQETEFKINAKRNKLLGTWAASILKLDEEQKKKLYY